MSKPITSLLAPIPVFCGALVFLAGCATDPESHLVSAPPPPAPNTVTTTTVSTPMVVATPTYVATSNGMPVTNTVVVTQAPPAMPQEVVLAQPSPQDVWIPGYWTWRNNQYQWMTGQWVLPPSSSSTWVAPRWEQEGNAYRFYEGSWN